MLKRILLIVSILSLSLMFGLSFCDSEDSTDPIDKTTTTTSNNSNESTEEEKSGTITVTVNGVTGYNDSNHSVMILVNPVDDTNWLGIYCEDITSDPFSLDSVVIQSMYPEKKCGEFEGNDKIFDAGEYIIFVYVIPVGQQTPERYIKFPKEVDGNISVTTPDFTTWY